MPISTDNFLDDPTIENIDTETEDNQAVTTPAVPNPTPIGNPEPVPHPEEAPAGPTTRAQQLRSDEGATRKPTSSTSLWRT